MNCEVCVILFSQSRTTVLSDDLTAERISAVFGVTNSWLNTGSLIFAWKNYWVYSDVFPRQDNCGRGGAMIIYGRGLAVLLTCFPDHLFFLAKTFAPFP